jgi:asparagine synthetase B (glutamine-hydrolysing)
MCGIVGVLSNTSLTTAEKEAIKWMSYFDYVRGVHSTGYMFGNQHFTRVVKSLGSPETLWNHPDVRDTLFNDGVLLSTGLNFIVGHNRAATKGAVTARNAHPFVQDHIIGVHNGTTTYGLDSLPSSKDFEVDSEAILHAMSKGITLKEIINRVFLSYVLVWVDEKEKTFNLARNAQRPLYIIEDKIKTMIYFASEPWILERSLSQAGIRSQFEAPKLLDTDLQLTFDLTQKDIIKTAKGRKLEKNTNVSKITYHPSKEQPEKNYASSRVAPALWDKRKKLTPAEFEIEIKGCECVFCGSNSLEYDEYVLGAMQFIKEKSPVCSTCLFEVEVLSIGKEGLHANS